MIHNRSFQPSPHPDFFFDDDDAYRRPIIAASSADSSRLVTEFLQRLEVTLMTLKAALFLGLLTLPLKILASGVFCQRLIHELAEGALCFGDAFRLQSRKPHVIALDRDGRARQLADHDGQAVVRVDEVQAHNVSTVLAGDMSLGVLVKVLERSHSLVTAQYCQW